MPSCATVLRFENDAFVRFKMGASFLIHTDRSLFAFRRTMMITYWRHLRCFNTREGHIKRPNITIAT